MSEALLKYYNRELAYLRRQGAEFAKQYPKVAGRLRISEEAVEDPHVSRLLEGVAFMTAQIRQRLDGHFPELADVLLGSLYPDYQSPIPSMTVAQLKPAPALSSHMDVKAGLNFTTLVENMPECYFSAVGNHVLANVSVDSANFENAPFDAPRPQGSSGAQAVIKLRLSAPLNFSEIKLPYLRFYLHGQTHHSHELYELIHRSALGFAIAPASDSRQLRFYGKEHIKAVGFGAEDAVVPYSKRSFDGYRLLVEHFLFAEKFLFADLADLDPDWPDDKELDIYIYLAEGSAEQEKSLVPDHLRLGCVPMVNTFETLCETLRFEEEALEYRLVPNYRNADSGEVVRIMGVELVKSDEVLPLAPYYGLHHPRWQDSVSLYWHARRRYNDWAGGQYEPGTETYLSLVNKDFEHQDEDELPRDRFLRVKVLACNRNAPAQLPFGGGQPKMRSEDAYIHDVKVLLAPSPTVRPELGDATRWQFIRHLSLEHFAGPDALDRLKAVLHLHDFKQTPESRALIEGIEAVSIKPAVARVGSGVRKGLCQGNDISIRFSKPRYAGASVYLFSAVLDRFFAQFAQLNTFTRLRIKLTGHNQDYHVWPTRVGERELL
ncbi:type VI secretion system baseplate subunit TssF [Gallaecimonas pentaromativorans]|uniref:Type VI secretion system protein ImpG n=1 Tax=Gallaecimonas pentaromativorans TaxID=584787 RepID=A0A3N1PF75_9GAMM|nr:type VI secretion system baseplate subunit TssF [Gallaecimonas pentaromativorans]ROQ30604.1 type VI secretion system protein ImpG [Gallaecimonas pentaromativorans]